MRSCKRSDDGGAGGGRLRLWKIISGFARFAEASSIDRHGTGNTKDEILYVMYCNISHIITFLASHVAMSIA